MATLFGHDLCWVEVHRGFWRVPVIVHGSVCARTQMQEMVTTGRLQDWLSSGTFTRLGRKPSLVCCGEKLGFPPAEAQWSFERRRAAGNGEHAFPVDTGLERRAPKSFKWGRGVDGEGIPGAWRSDSLECRVGSSLPPAWHLLPGHPGDLHGVMKSPMETSTQTPGSSEPSSPPTPR